MVGIGVSIPESGRIFQRISLSRSMEDMENPWMAPDLEKRGGGICVNMCE
jgi:hypothetical protein